MIAEVTAAAALIAALAAVGSAVAAVIAAINARRGKAIANETRELLRQSIAIQQTQHQSFHFHGPTTVGSVAMPPSTELAFPPEAVPLAIPAALPVEGEEQGQDQGAALEPAPREEQ
jgi:hypothetical protein